MQILFINLVTDSLPAIALGMEVADKDVMKQKPRKQNESIIGGKVGFNLIYQGIVQALIVVGVIVLAKNLYGNEIAATMGFLTLNFLQLVHMFNVRTNGSIFNSNPFKNKTIWIALFAGAGLTLLISLVPVIAGIFHLSALNLTQWLIVLGASFVIVPIVEIVKIIQRAVCKRK